MPKFFTKLRLLIFMKSCAKLIKCSAHLCRHSNNIMVIFYYTIAFFVIFHAAFFSDYQRQFLTQKSFNQYGFAPDCLPVIRVSCSYLKINFSLESLVHFQNKLAFQDKFYLLYQDYTNIFSIA